MKLRLTQVLFFSMLILAGTKGKTQTVIFSENMGTSGAAANPAITAFSQFQNSGCSYTYTGTGDVRTSSSSSGAYTGASGVNNVFLNNGANRTFIISGINTLDYTAMSLSYGLYNSSALSVGLGLTVEVSTNGTTYTVLTRSGNLWVLAGWLPETSTGAIPSTSNLYIRFTNISTSLDFRIDDLVLSGTPSPSTNPTPYNGWPASYSFSNWAAASTPGTYPPNMVFHYGAVGVAQPVLNDITASYNYANAYNLSATNNCSSLISGRGTSGISFVDRNPGNANSTGNLGEAVLALNTTCRSNIQVAWQTNTYASNGTIYQLRAQYRVGTTGAYTNLPNNNIAQIRHTSPAGITNFGPITLPGACENQPVVQIRWAYYYAGPGSGTGTGDEISLTNISVSSSTYPLINALPNLGICSAKAVPAVNFGASPAGASFSWTNTNPLIGLAAAGSGNIASYTAPSVLTPPDRIGVVTVTAALNSCTSTSSFSITIKGPQLSSVWTGSASTDWFDHDNWSNCSCTGITSATIAAVSSPGFNPVIGGAAAASASNITLSSGASLSVQSTQSLNINGNWTNNGSFSPQKGYVLLTGSAAQSIGGTATTSFYNLTLNNASGASLASAQRIAGNLQLNAGIFNTNNLLTLSADASGTGRIGPINAAADIINQVTVEQHAFGGSTGWALMGSPITPALTMADWNDDFMITCASCPNGPLGGFTSIYSYNETVAGSYSVPAKYFPITSITNNITNGKGYWVYLGNGTSTTTAINIDVTGTVAKSSCLSCGSPVSLPVSRTNNTSLFDDGWNLLANPLPSPISWTLLRNGNASVDNALYVYNADLLGGTGGYATYINGVSSTLLGGITDTIPIAQGFYVHAIASTTLVAGENTKLNGSPAFLKSSAAAARPLVRLVMSGANAFNDMATFYFDPGGSVNFQTGFDAYKLIYDLALPHIGSMSDSVYTSISGLPDTYTTLAIPVKAITSATGSFSFSLLSSDFPDNVCVTLYDALTNITTDLLTSEYSCQLYDTTSIARFTLSFVSSPLSASSAFAHPNCSSPVNGTITAVGNTPGPWNYVWKSGSSVIKTSVAKATADTLIAPGGAGYSVRMNTTGQCDNYSQTFNLSSIQMPAAGFSMTSATAYVSDAGQVSFVNTSENAQSYTWNFGDGSGTSTLSSPVYNYGLEGTYDVLLLAQSSSGCTHSATAQVIVIDDATALNEPVSPSFTLILYSDNEGSYMLAMDLKTAQNVALKLYDSNGRLLRSSLFNRVTSQTAPIDLDGFASGIYYLNARMDLGVEKTFKLIK